MERLIINGFFAKGNCGDEAIIQTWYDKLSHKYRIVVSLDQELLVNNDFKNHTNFYNNVDIIQNRRVDIFCRDDIKGLIIGGGGLGLGFGVEQWLHSVLRKKKRMYLGTIVHEEFFEGDQLFFDINKNFFKSFDLISVRDKHSYNNLVNIFDIKDAQFYPDIAFSLETSEIDIKTDKDYICVVVRDNGSNDFEKINMWLDKIKTYAKSNNYDILYLPFDKSDENLMKQLNLDMRYPDIFWNPKGMKYIISKSKMVFSLGRYHPLIFGVSSGVTSYYINCQIQDGAWRYSAEGKDKSHHLLNDFGMLEYYLTNANINDEFKVNSEIGVISKGILYNMDGFFELVLSKLA